MKKAEGSGPPAVEKGCKKISSCRLRCLAASWVSALCCHKYSDINRRAQLLVYILPEEGTVPLLCLCPSHRALLKRPMATPTANYPVRDYPGRYYPAADYPAAGYPVAACRTESQKETAVAAAAAPKAPPPGEPRVGPASGAGRRCGAYAAPDPARANPPGLRQPPARHPGSFPAGCSGSPPPARPPAHGSRFPDQSPRDRRCSVALAAVELRRFSSGYRLA